jgi:hypothetical protein
MIRATSTSYQVKQPNQASIPANRRELGACGDRLVVVKGGTTRSTQNASHAGENEIVRDQKGLRSSGTNEHFAPAGGPALALLI